MKASNRAFTRSKGLHEIERSSRDRTKYRAEMISVPEMGSETILVVRLVVDGTDIPMNHFTQEIMEKVVSGVAESLRGVDSQWKSMVVEVERDDKTG